MKCYELSDEFKEAYRKALEQYKNDFVGDCGYMCEYYFWRYWRSMSLVMRIKILKIKGYLK